MKTAEEMLEPTFHDATPPTHVEWGCYFLSHPAELERLAAADAASGKPAPRSPPSGARATARGWARYFRTHPDELAACGRARRKPAVPRPIVGPDGRRRWTF